MNKNILLGNGVNIQHNGYDSTNSAIVYRALKSLGDNDFPQHILGDNPIDIKLHFGRLFSQLKAMCAGEYDKFCTCNAECDALEDFKIRYKDKSSLKVTDIGFEDYYLIHDLVCHKTGINNPIQFDVRQTMVSVFLDAIYNKNIVNTIYNSFNINFIKWLNTFNKYFTLNYNENIDFVTYKKVFHLHGDFKTRKDIYVPNSARNQLSDYPIKDYVIDEKFTHLYSTALSTHCGDYKESILKQHTIANDVLERLAKAYIKDPETKKEINSWVSNKNRLVSNLGESIILKVRNKDYEYKIEYPIIEFKNITGELYILGVSPYNDKHLFEMINNTPLEKCIYYYYDESEKEIITKLISNIVLEFIDVKEFWNQYSVKKAVNKKTTPKKHKFIDIRRANFIKYANCFRELSLSILSDVEIVKQFNTLNNIQKNEIVSKVKTITSPVGYNNDEQFILRIIDIHLIAEEYDIDPAVVMCVGTINNKGNHLRLK